MIERLFNALIETVQRLKDAYLRVRIRQRLRRNYNAGGKQDLDIYWDEEFAESLAVWGEGTVWREIEHLLATAQGKVLDIACGTGSVIKRIGNEEELDVYGCDISDLLIERAVKSGIPRAKLEICDATKTPYQDDAFHYSFSIGSLEHFSEAGITDFLRECRRITKLTSYHQIPVSGSGRDEGWMKLGQSYFNNSVEWWMKKFQSIYNDVRVLDSSWSDPISVGKWFVCTKERHSLESLNKRGLFR